MAADKLAAVSIKQAKPAEKSYKLTDGGGMYSLVNTKGGKFRRLDYCFA